MNGHRRAIWILTVAVGLLVISQPIGAQSVGSRYVTTSIRGKLSDPDTQKPMVGATVRFVSTEEAGSSAEAVTDEQGEFSVTGLGYSDYAVEIETAQGEHIKGINTLPLSPDRPVEVVMKISDRVPSKTLLTNRPERFLVIVEKGSGVNWRRFWTGFAIFFGVAAPAGAAAW